MRPLKPGLTASVHPIRMAGTLQKGAKSSTVELGPKEKAAVLKMQADAKEALLKIQQLRNSDLQRQKSLMLSKQLLEKMQRFLETLSPEQQEKLKDSKHLLAKLMTETQATVEQLSDIPMEASGGPGKRPQSNFEKELLRNMILDVASPNAATSASAVDALLKLKVSMDQIQQLKAQLNQGTTGATLRFGMQPVSVDGLIEQIAANNPLADTVNTVVARNTSRLVNHVAPILFGQWDYNPENTYIERHGSTGPTFPDN